MCNNSPIIRPKAAPTLNTGMKLPEGTGIVDEIIENTNCRRRRRKIVFKGNADSFVRVEDAKTNVE